MNTPMPASVRIFGIDYTILFQTPSLSSESLAEVSYKRCEICIDKTVRSELVLPLLLHEVLHTINERLQLPKSEERFVETLASSLSAVFYDNRSLFIQLINEGQEPIQHLPATEENTPDE